MHYATVNGFTICGILSHSEIHPFCSSILISSETKSRFDLADKLLSKITLGGVFINGILHPWSTLLTCYLCVDSAFR